MTNEMLQCRVPNSTEIELLKVISEFESGSKGKVTSGDLKTAIQEHVTIAGLNQIKASSRDTGTVRVQSCSGWALRATYQDQSGAPIKFDPFTGETSVELKGVKVTDAFKVGVGPIEADPDCVKISLVIPAGVNGPGFSVQPEVSVMVPSVDYSGPYPTGPGVLLRALRDWWRD